MRDQCWGCSVSGSPRMNVTCRRKLLLLKQAQFRGEIAQADKRSFESDSGRGDGCPGGDRPLGKKFTEVCNDSQPVVTVI